MGKSVLVLVFLGFISVQAQASFEGGFLSLSQDQQEQVLQQIEKNGIANEYSAMPNSPWPEHKHYVIIHASPAESTAVFHDYARQTEFMNWIKKSEVRSITPTVDEVETTMLVGVSFFHHLESYVVRNTVEMDLGSLLPSYRITAQMVQTAEHIKEGAGDAIFEALPSDPTGGTTICTYSSRVIPLIPWFIIPTMTVDPSKNMTKKTVLTLVAHVEDVKTNHKDLLQEEIWQLSQAFNKQLEAVQIQSVE